MKKTTDKNIPQHIGLIIDGNRRWAKKRGLLTLEGHRRGLNKLKELGNYILESEVKILTVFCFSTENWNRKKSEVRYLMKLFGEAMVEKNIEEYHKKGICIKVIGQIERLDLGLQKQIKQAQDKTKNNKNGILNLAISYGGRAEIIAAIKEIIKDKKEITEDSFAKYLWTSGLPYPDLIIRSGGERRLSNFLTWQSAYSELYFSEKHWPDFTKKDIDAALEDYSKRQKRFGA
jgi:undecaprenyl diphosphate synthase